MPFVPVTLKVTNSANSNPIAGARVFIDGSATFDPAQFTVVTDATGMAQFQVPSNLQNRQLQVTADGFSGSGAIINTAALSSQIVAVSLAPNVVGSSVINLQFIPAVAGILWQLKQGVFIIDNDVSNASGISQSTAPITFGSYTIEADLVGYQHLSSPIIVNGQTDPYTLTLIAIVDVNSTQQGNTNGDSSALTSQPANIVSQVTTVPPAQAEYIYPNTDYDKYFTITGARIYIGNLFIDECNTIQYALQDNALPIYGYASRFVDAYGQGRSLVQGQLTLNFVTEGYLYTALKEYQRYLSSTQGKGFPISTPKIDVVAQTLGLMATRDNLLQTATHNNDPSSEIQAGKIQQQIAALLTAMSPVQISALNNQRERQLKTFTDVIGFDNAVYQDVLFDIRIELGNEVTGVKRVRYLEKCKLISNEQVMDQSGNVILDSYGFIARRLR